MLCRNFDANTWNDLYLQLWHSEYLRLPLSVWKERSLSLSLLLIYVEHYWEDDLSNVHLTTRRVIWLISFILYPHKSICGLHTTYYRVATALDPLSSPLCFTSPHVDRLWSGNCKLPSKEDRTWRNTSLLILLCYCWSAAAAKEVE